jgi:DNA mismatch endonuclease (patch repair protein)
MDKVTPAQRSATMRAIRSKDTKPELALRRQLHRLGYRYRVHVRGLPGTPDLVFTRRRAVIFVHGCYWHAHGCKVAGSAPASNTEYWSPKLARNKARDAAQVAALEAAGWRVLVLWECEVARLGEATDRAVAFLGSRASESGMLPDKGALTRD